METEELEKKAEEMLVQPKVVEVDGQRVENQSVADLVTAAKFLASKSATSGRRCPLRVTRMAAGGAVL